MIVEEETKVVEIESAKVTVCFNDAQKDLDSVLPILEEAQAAVNTLNTADIAEVKGTNVPTKGYLDTFTAVYILLERKTDYKKVEWKMLKTMLSGPFFDRLKSFNKDDVPEKVVKALN